MKDKFSHEISDQPKGFFSHFGEFRNRVILTLSVFALAFILGYMVSEPIYQFLMTPLSQALMKTGAHRKLIYTGVAEAFLTYVRVAFFVGCFVTFPFGLFHLWRFMLPGLFPHEKKICRLMFILIPVLFLAGSLFAYYVVFPNVFTFFLSFENWQSDVPMVLEARMYEYLSFISHTLLAFGLAFQLPIALYLLVTFGMIRYESLKKQWRIWILIITVVSAIITPPDVLSMASLMIPLILLYGLALLMIGLTQKKDGPSYD